jgi:hypothetical protein
LITTPDSSPDDLESRSDELLRNYLRRNRSLQRWAWISIAVPLIIFIGLTVLAVNQGKKYIDLVAKSEQLQKEIDAKNKQLAVKELAISIVKEQNPGQRPEVVIFRPSIAPQVKEALEQLGYTVDLQSYRANPTLTDKSVDTLSYGCAVSNEDIRTIVTALAKADLPIRAIGPATRNRDPNLVQLVASGATSPNDPPIRMEDWSRSDKPCLVESTSPR